MFVGDSLSQVELTVGNVDHEIARSHVGHVPGLPVRGLAAAYWITVGVGEPEAGKGSFVKTNLFRLGVCPGMRLEATCAVHCFSTPALWQGGRLCPGREGGRQPLMSRPCH